MFAYVELLDATDLCSVTKGRLVPCSGKGISLCVRDTCSCLLQTFLNGEWRLCVRFMNPLHTPLWQPLL